MSEGEVDLSQIRGDWKFHIDYIQNAIEKTLIRQRKYWAELGDNADIDASVKQVSALWEELKSGANDQGTISTTDGKMEEFIEACLASKEICDAYETANEGNETIEEFCEATRQARSMCPDLELMKGQRPDNY